MYRFSLLLSCAVLASACKGGSAEQDPAAAAAASARASQAEAVTKALGEALKKARAASASCLQATLASFDRASAVDAGAPAKLTPASTAALAGAAPFSVRFDEGQPPEISSTMDADFLATVPQGLVDASSASCPAPTPTQEQSANGLLAISLWGDDHNQSIAHDLIDQFRRISPDPPKLAAVAWTDCKRGKDVTRYEELSLSDFACRVGVAWLTTGDGKLQAADWASASSPSTEKPAALTPDRAGRINAATIAAATKKALALLQSDLARWKR